MLNEMPLHELRQARGLSQKMLAEHLRAAWAYVSVNATQSHPSDGGELEVIARFPDGAVKISNFAELGAPTQTAMPS